MLAHATGVLIHVFAREYRENGTLPGEAAAKPPDAAPVLVWPENALPNLAALVLLGTLLLLWWWYLRQEGPERSR